MYHCPVTFYLVGLPDEIARIIEDAQPQPSFTHHFTRSDEPEEALTAQASAIFADATGHDAAAWARVFAAHRQATTTVTLIVSHDQVPAVEPYFNDIADLWIAPLSAAEASWRFNHWQRACKRYADSWETSQYLEATINSIPSLVWYKSKDGIHHKVNDAFCATVNKTKEQVQGRGHAYIWDVEADDPACIESERRVMAAKSTIVSEETVQTSDGTRLLTTYKSPLYNIDGSVMGTVGVGIDVTQERAYEDEIVEKNHTMETIFTTMDCGVITHSLDGTRLLGINQAALDILGYDSAEDLMAAGFDMVAPSVISEDAAKMRESIATLKNVGDSVSTEYRVRHDDGSIVHVMGNVKLIESDGELLLQRYLLDYTDKKKEEVRKERRQRDLIQALSEDYLLVCSFRLDTQEGEVLRISGDRLRKFDTLFAGDLIFESCLGGYINEAVVEEDQAMLRETLSAKNLLDALTDRARIHVNYRIRRGEDTEYCQATIVRNGDWRMAHDIILGLRSVDVQTREEMKKRALLEEALTQANKANAAKSAFLSNMSHDIRTPMNAIVGFTTLAASRIDQPERVQEYLGKIQSSSAHLLSLINDILDMSHIESGKVSLDEQPYNLVDLLDEPLQHHPGRNERPPTVLHRGHHRGTPCRRALRQAAHQPDPAEPARQRPEVHEPRRLREGEGRRARWRAGGLRALPVHRVGHGHRHEPGVRRAHLRPVRTRAHLHHQRHPGNRPGHDHHQEPRRHDARLHRREERPGQGHRLHHRADPAAGRQKGGGSA